MTAVTILAFGIAVAVIATAIGTLAVMAGAFLWRLGRDLSRAGAG